MIRHPRVHSRTSARSEAAATGPDLPVLEYRFSSALPALSFPVVPSGARRKVSGPLARPIPIRTSRMEH
jgi:hypothetical protein